MTQDTQIVLPFARLSGKHLQADFDGGTLSSDGGVLFLREIEAQVGIISRFARCRRSITSERVLDNIALFQLTIADNIGAQSSDYLIMSSHCKITAR